MIAPQDENDRQQMEISSADPPGQSASDASYSVGSCFVSPDGALALTIAEDVDGEELIGFHGFEWTVQVSVLGELSGKPAEEAKQIFVDEIRSDQLLIAVLYRFGEVTDIWVTDDPEMDKNYLKANEELVFRHWSGQS